MEVQLSAHSMEITPHLQEYVEKRVNKLERYLPDIEEVRVDLAVENTRSSAHRQVAQVTVQIQGTILRAEERGADMFATIDKTMDKMRRQASRYKTRRQDRRQRGEEEIVPEEEGAAPVEIVRVKRFEMIAMTPAEAIEQMELLGHMFFLFLNGEDGQINLVYRRKDGGYGLIIPEVR